MIHEGSITYSMMRLEFTLANRERVTKGVILFNIMDILEEYMGLAHEAPPEIHIRPPRGGTGETSRIISELQPEGRTIYVQGARDIPNFDGTLITSNIISSGLINYTPPSINVDRGGAVVTTNEDGDEVVRIDRRGISIRGVLVVESDGTTHITSNEIPPSMRDFSMLLPTRPSMPERPSLVELREGAGLSGLPNSWAEGGRNIPVPPPTRSIRDGERPREPKPGSGDRPRRGLLGLIDRVFKHHS